MNSILIVLIARLSLPEHHNHDHHHQYGANARSSSSFAPRASLSHELNVPRGDDHDDHKYRRKPIMEVIRTWLKLVADAVGSYVRSASRVLDGDDDDDDTGFDQLSHLI